MFARFTYLHFTPETTMEAVAVYASDIAPVIRKQKGNKQALLLEPADDSHEFISYSLWEEEADVKAFEASADYQPVIARIKELVSAPPIQKYYHING